MVGGRGREKYNGLCDESENVSECARMTARSGERERVRMRERDGRREIEGGGFVLLIF
jgi:hypothetical protein